MFVFLLRSCRPTLLATAKDPSRIATTLLLATRWRRLQAKGACLYRRGSLWASLTSAPRLFCSSRRPKTSDSPCILDSESKWGRDLAVCDWLLTEGEEHCGKHEKDTNSQNALCFMKDKCQTCLWRFWVFTMNNLKRFITQNKTETLFLSSSCL